MAKGNCILVTANPKGVFEECIVSGTPKPGVVMESKGTVAAVGGRFTYEPAGTTAANSTYTGMAADGDNVPCAVLLSDVDSGVSTGRDATTAFTSGDRAMLYYPLPGEEVNMILLNIAGTAAGEDYVIGSKLIVDDGTGKLVQSTGTVDCEEFISLELKTDLAADYLCWVKKR